MMQTILNVGVYVVKDAIVVARAPSKALQATVFPISVSRCEHG